MNLMYSIIKLIIRFFSLIIKKSKAAKKYLFSVALKNETQEFYDTEYFQNYSHIWKAIKTLQQLEKKDFIIIDIGGADGTTGKMFAGSFPNNEVWIFEPILENLKKLENVKSQFKNIVIIPKAAGNSTQSTTINKAASITSSSLFSLRSDLASPLLANAITQIGIESIEMTRLDDIITNSSIGILKMDVQGYELEVLKGGTNTLRHTDIIITEMNNHDGYYGSPKYYELDKFIRENNFILFDIFPSLKDNEELKEWDCIYLKKGIRN